MNLKKYIILIILTIFLFSIASVSASDTNETLMTSIDDSPTELSKTDEKVIDQKNMNDKTGAGEGTYEELKNEIGTGGDKNLTKSYYKYTGGNTIEISTPGVINGNGAVIDMNGSNIRAFYVTASGVTIKNLTISNTNSNGDGGAIYFEGRGSLTNCNFINNRATGGYGGGAIYFKGQGSVTNCNFINNQATVSYGGGAIYFKGQGDVTNCNFNNNQANSNYGGAIYIKGTGNVTNCNFTNNQLNGPFGGGAIYFQNTGNVTNCIFNNNTANRGGAIYSLKWATTADTCIFKTSSDTMVNVVTRSPTLNVDNFTSFYGSGEKLIFNLTTNSGMPVTNGNISISVYFKDNNSGVCNYTCLSGEEWVPDLPVGSYYAIFNTEYAGFTPVNRTITIHPNNAFWMLNNIINANNNNVINLTNDYYYDPAFDGAFANGIVINRKVTINGNGYAIDAKGKARVFIVRADDVAIKKLNIINAYANGNGGAIYFSGTGTVTNCNFINNTANYGGAFCFDKGSVLNCNFINNTAKMHGGAFHSNKQCDVVNCNFINNTADGYGGAVHSNKQCNVVNCNFTGNKAIMGSAIYFDCYDFSNTLTISNSIFLNNRANADSNTPFNVTINEKNITITFIGQNNHLNAIYSNYNDNVTFVNVTYWGMNGIETITSTKSGSNREAGQNITVSVVVNDKVLLNELLRVTDENGTIVLDLEVNGSYYICVRHIEDSYYTGAEKIFENMKYVNITSQTTTNKTVNITAKSNIFNESMPGKLLFILPNNINITANYAGNGTWWANYTFDKYGEFEVRALYIGLNNVTVNNATITINKIKTELSADAVTTTYNVNKYLTITLKDVNGNPLKGVSIYVDLNGAKTYTTDGNGQVKVSTKGLAPKTYTAKVTFNGNDIYDKSVKNVKVTVKKAASKITAAKKTFKAKTKVKKYAAVLKDNTGKAIKNARLTLKVRGKTYSAKTNYKGKAVFKITKLNKKGTYKAVIKFNGNKYYLKSTKNTKITVKASKTTFKTVSRQQRHKNS